MRIEEEVIMHVPLSAKEARELAHKFMRRSQNYHECVTSPSVSKHKHKVAEFHRQSQICNSIAAYLRELANLMEG